MDGQKDRGIVTENKESHYKATQSINVIYIGFIDHIDLHDESDEYVKDETNLFNVLQYKLFSRFT